MSLKETLQYLMPIDLGGDHRGDLEHDARMLEAARQHGEISLTEMFPDGAAALLIDWERVYGLTPGADDPLQLRRDRVVRAVRQRGGLSIPYFRGLALAMGYSVEIEEPVPSMVGWLHAGDELMAPEVIWQWGVKISGTPLYPFRAGESTAGESLLWWTGKEELERLFVALKPAHTYVYFNYEES
ncbi:putative phage tail protein [Desulfobulbus sp.]|uniref:putative phage tail protein n=1 Tax=Desulfobulbus sp. TaxID=895 RepID=UPI00286FABC7|nr:putative phage tail protein [Desulfobulbus sp.]